MSAPMEPPNRRAQVSRDVLLRPLGAFETLYYRYAQRNPLHFAVAAEFGIALGESGVRSALAAVQHRHPLLSAYVEDRPDGRLAFHRPEIVAPIELTVSRQPSHEWQTHAARELSRPFDRSRAPLMRALLIGDRSASTLLLTFDHTIADGISAVLVLDDVVAALNGEHLTPLPLPASQEDMIARSLPAVESFPDFSAADPRMTPACSIRAFDSATTLEIHKAELSATETTRLVQRCRAERTTVHAALVAAASRVRGKERGEDFIGVFTAINFRDLIGADRDCADYFVGTRTGMAPLDGSSVWDQARVVGGELAGPRSAAGVATTSAVIQQSIPADAGVEAVEDFLVSNLSFELMISNLGVREVGGARAVRPTAVWGPIVFDQVDGEYASGVITYDNRLRIVTCGHTPVETFVEEVRGVLLEACA